MFKLDLFNKKQLSEQDKKLKRLSNIIDEKNAEINRQYNSITRLEDNAIRLTEENQKLINWIMNILDTVGTMETREKTEFKIPICRHKEYRAYDRNYMGIFEKERITIPEITIIKMG